MKNTYQYIRTRDLIRIYHFTLNEWYDKVAIYRSNPNEELISKMLGLDERLMEMQEEFSYRR